MRVAGLMSGTSADGIDVAFVRITGRGAALKARLESFCTLPFSAAVRRKILRIANANRAPTLSVAEISQLNFLLGELFAEAVVRAARRFRLPLKSVDLIGSHGQTVFHQPTPEVFAGRRVVSTLQLGEPQIIAERTGIPVAANFRPRDMAAGGQGAPLVPFVDCLLYRHPRKGRVALNLGGIANVTVIPAGAQPEQVVAFDTGVAMATAKVSALFPGMAAATLGTPYIGPPHIHNHPPSLVPPAPPVPLPSLGAVSVAGCLSVL
ncbi:MAG: anhydro-N-acetylmuramic acid kinase, partial [Acidobacteria bacterium]|nr:anhydro-N-acetylmuramic acid kinase [Acidobacteriota bacterium]